MNDRWKLTDDQRVIVFPLAIWVAFAIPVGGLAGSIPRHLHTALALVGMAAFGLTGVVMKARLRRKRRKAASLGEIS